MISAGYDENSYYKNTNGNDRITLSANNSFKTLKDKLEITTGITVTSATSNSNAQGYGGPNYSYERLADETGKPLPVQRTLRAAYVDTIGQGSLLNWHFIPLNENYSNSTDKRSNYTLNAGMNYQIINGLSASFLYQFQKQINEGDDNYDEESYYARDLLNKYSKVNYQAGTASRPVPFGNIKYDTRSQLEGNYGRFQLNYNDKDRINR